MADKMPKRPRLQRMPPTLPPLQEGVGRALRGAYAPDLIAIPKDMRDLLDRLK